MSSESEKPFHRVAAVGDVPLGCGIQVTIDHNDIALFNVGGEFFAIDDLCPHRGAALSQGFLEQDKVFCPLHCFDFNLKTGESQVASHLRVSTYPTKTENGDVFVQH